MTTIFNADRVNGLLLGIVLLYCGFHLYSSASAIHSDRKRDRTALSTNQRLPFTTAKGIDVFGKPVSLAKPSKDKPLDVFLLRGDRINQDLFFWRSVSDLTRRANLTLVAYCDGISCSDSVRRLPSSPPFKIIEYGEAISSQSLINDDREGYLVQLADPGRRPKMIQWRAADSTPLNVSIELERHEN